MGVIWINPFLFSSGAVVSGMIGQWQSDAGVTTSGSEVTAVADQSGAGNSLSRADGTGPTLVSNVVNGLPAFQHSSTAKRLSRAISQLSATNTYTMFLVRSPYDQTQNGGNLVMDLNGGGGPQLSLGQGAVGDYRVGGFWNSTFQSTGAVYRGHATSALFDIVAAVRSGANVTFYKNGVAVSSSISGSSTTTTTPSIYLGGDQAGNAGPGMWAQARLYDSALNSTDLAAVFTALGTKYNIPIRTASGTALDRSGWTVSAWSTCGGSLAETSAIDADTNTRFTSCASPSAGSAWFKIDLGSAQTVGGVQIHNVNWSGDTPVAYDVQWSDDNSSWTTVASGTTSNNSTIVSSWTPASHRYWRLLAQGAAQGGGWWSIGEIYLYSDSAP